MIYTNDRYRANVEFIINKPINEYDISKANINILFHEGVINKNSYNYYYNLPKMKRERSIGYFLRNNQNASAILSNGFKKFRKIFFESNNIDPNRVLYIDKDAITLVDFPITNTKFDNIIFANKVNYTSFYHIPMNGSDFLYYSDNKIENYRFKYMDENVPLNHINGMLDILLSIAYAGQHEQIPEVLNMIKSIYIDYINLKLPIIYYKSFNSASKYRYKDSMLSDFMLSNINNFDNIDISFNASIISHFYKIYSNMLFMHYKYREPKKQFFNR